MRATFSMQASPKRLNFCRNLKSLVFDLTVREAAANLRRTAKSSGRMEGESVRATALTISTHSRGAAQCAPCLNIASQSRLESLGTGVLFLNSLRKRYQEKRCYLMGCNDSSG